MQLLHVTARAADRHGPALVIPDHDVSPVLLAITCKRTEYFLRDMATQAVQVDKPAGHTDIARMFVRTQCKAAKRIDDCDSPNGVLADTHVNIAVSLASIFFGKGDAWPMRRNFTQHILDRTGAADCVVVAGYTDTKCSLASSERLAMERALNVRGLLRAGGLALPCIAVARPAYSHGPEDKYDRRVEVTAVFRNEADDFTHVSSARDLAQRGEARQQARLDLAGDFAEPDVLPPAVEEGEPVPVTVARSRPPARSHHAVKVPARDRATKPTATKGGSHGEQR